MANHKFKRSTRSSQRGRGKNHSVNREKSRHEKKKARKIKAFRDEQKERHKRYKLAKRLYMEGVCEDYNQAIIKAFSCNKNFLDNPEQWF